MHHAKKVFFLEVEEEESCEWKDCREGHHPNPILEADCSHSLATSLKHLIIYLGSKVAFSTVLIISLQVVLWAEETSTYSWSRFCTVNCQLSVSNYQLSHVGPRFELQTSEVGDNCVTTAPLWPPIVWYN